MLLRDGELGSTHNNGFAIGQRGQRDVHGQLQKRELWRAWRKSVLPAPKLRLLPAMILMFD